ncbi:uncharacterized protein BDW70DRAFT_136114 [Aspergillus foveolatus]|uniref:uncharacterized protein n=1 Tax=Aspergillus foveolatus TaxID=210207 RepID=UPI003CCD42AD
MSGNYDHPPASRRVVRGSRSGDRSYRPNTNRLQHLRNLLNTERNRNTSARALETLDQELEEFRSERARDRSFFERTRAVVDQQIRSIRGESGTREDPIHGASSSSGNRLQRLQDFDAISYRGSRPSDRLGRGRRNRESILDQSVPPLESPSAMPLEPGHDHEMDRLRVKRRKLDSDDNREGLQSLRYGQFGQVVPGTLKMELASCDGGTYPPVCETSGPENILRDDSSVYCTKSDRCNLILKHRGEAPFCLRKLVIKAPKSGYDAPIQAGMVFISMSADELLARTAQYQIQHASSRSRRGRRRSGMQPSEEYLNSYRTPLQTLGRATLAGFDSPSDSDTDASEFLGASSSLNADQSPQFRVITEYDERSDGTQLDRLEDSFLESQSSEPGGPDELRALHPMYPIEEDFLCSDTEDSSGGEDESSESRSYNSRRRELQRQVRAMRRQYAMEHDDSPRRHNTMQPTLLIPPSMPRSGPTARPSSGGLMRPLAQFFIKRPKSSVSLKFDPPPSGRYILIKLWSPYHAGNIDIQSVTAHGYAGPRFFPAVGPR